MYAYAEHSAQVGLLVVLLPQGFFVNDPPQPQGF